MNSTESLYRYFPHDPQVSHRDRATVRAVEAIPLDNGTELILTDEQHGERIRAYVFDDGPCGVSRIELWR